ncbi:MAG: hypothetical protein KGJ70_03870 [Gemmatimonadota bacterium]|nr:hypothetical protein [Gemmatimonadota bacterium]
MDVREERFDESSRANAVAEEGYRHVGTTYRITEGGETLLYRKFDQVPARADLLQPRGWTEAWLQASAFRAAASYLAQQAGITAIRLSNALSGGFEDVVFVERER